MAKKETFGKTVFIGYDRHDDVRYVIGSDLKDFFPDDGEEVAEYRLVRTGKAKIQEPVIDFKEVK